MRHKTIQILPDDLRLGPKGQRDRRSWPWRNMQIGDHVHIIAPSSYMGHVRSAAGGHARPDGSVRLRCTTVWRRWSDEAECWFTKLRVDCDPA